MSELQMMERVFTSFLQSEIPLETILIALSNSCVHGDNLCSDFSEPRQDKALLSLFDGFATSIKAARTIEA